MGKYRYEDVDDASSFFIFTNSLQFPVACRYFDRWAIHAFKIEW